MFSSTWPQTPTTPPTHSDQASLAAVRALLAAMALQSFPTRSPCIAEETILLHRPEIVTNNVTASNGRFLQEPLSL
jgi:hypothetical protein